MNRHVLEGSVVDFGPAQVNRAEVF
jgi:hypothetical protein